MKPLLEPPSWPFVLSITVTAAKISNTFGLNQADTNANSKLNVRSFGHIGNSVECLKTITMQWLPSPIPNLYVKNGSPRSKQRPVTTSWL